MLDVFSLKKLKAEKKKNQTQCVREIDAVQFLKDDLSDSMQDINAHTSKEVFVPHGFACFES